MDTINAIVDTLLQLFFGAFSWAPPVLGLSLLSAVAGVGVLWVFRKTSDQAAVRPVEALKMGLGRLGDGAFSEAPRH